MRFLATKIEKESSNEDSILVVQGEAPINLAMYPTNCGGHAGMMVLHVKHEWCRVLQCGKCQSEWNTCVICPSGYGSPLRTCRSITDHARLKSHTMALNLPKELLEPHHQLPEKSVTILHDLTDFESVLHRQDEVTVDTIVVVNSMSNFAKFVQKSPL
jgi:hypothetical protein